MKFNERAVKTEQQLIEWFPFSIRQYRAKPRGHDITDAFFFSSHFIDEMEWQSLVLNCFQIAVSDWTADRLCKRAQLLVT